MLQENGSTGFESKSLLTSAPMILADFNMLGEAGKILNVRFIGIFHIL